MEFQCKGDFVCVHNDFSLTVCSISAAKAPYRATFRVQNIGIEQVERCADDDYEFMQDVSQQYSQMVIFKVGDDVRQVKTERKFAIK